MLEIIKDKVYTSLRRNSSEGRRQFIISLLEHIKKKDFDEQIFFCFEFAEHAIM